MSRLEAVEAAIDEAIKPYIESMAKNMGKSFPIDAESGAMMNWSSWIAMKVAKQATEAANVSC